MTNESPPSYDSIKNNKAYKPSDEQQRQIDLLSQHTPVTELSAVSSNAETKYFDLLPSFQMFQSILRRDDRQFSEDLRSRPPGYEENNRSTNISRIGSIDANLNEVSSRLNEINLQQEYELQNYIADDVGLSPVMSQSQGEPNVNQESYGLSPLDIIDSLAKSINSPIDIQIYVTKDIPHLNMNNQLETRLKENTNGDFVNGYIIITNKSNKPIDFGLFTVSLEGAIKQKKYNKVLLKKYLKMYDLAASYGYTLVPNSAGIEYEPFATDLSDDCQIGLPDDRTLLPNKKYKKFFTFKFPNRLLDNSCTSNLLSHLIPPPSMGVDRSCFQNRGEAIELNKALSYGFLNIRGTPLLTRDYSFDDTSISYTIEAKFIDKKNSKESVSHDDINKDDYIISRSMQYFLKFVPKEIQHSNLKIYQELKNSITWDLICKQNDKIEKEINERLNQIELSIDELKNKNLLIHSQPENKKVNKIDNEPGLKSDTCEIFGKKKLFSSHSKIGESFMSIQIPNKTIPYSSPRLLMKYNEDFSLYYKDPVDLNIELNFITSESNTKPPLISSIDINLICWSYIAEYPVPFEIGYDLFYNNYLDNREDTVRSNLQIIKDQVSTYIDFVNDSNLELSKGSLMYLNSMKSLGIKKDNIREYFKSTRLDPHWKVQLDKKFHWKSNINSPLTIINKNNINLLPSFQSCLAGRLYCLEVNVKFKGMEGNDNTVKLDIPITVG
ncbi:unnamed protein product [Candida verbasci]|uniref:Ubiquitin ligase-binding protein BUL2 n=1 Tax=Candida verbasci TaxID=1227364 RepID=A0A9W4TXJ8_9ASCO|nr:unnamed protein product [Candida verbasci]